MKIELGSAKHVAQHLYELYSKNLKNAPYGEILSVYKEFVLLTTNLN